jgi:hypothetical protein
MALAEHPRGSTIRTDEEGTYIAYHRVCNNCQVELTSRNRAATGSLKCKVCLSADGRITRRANGTEADNYVPRPYQPRQRSEQGNVMRATAAKALEQSTDREMQRAKYAPELKDEALKRSERSTALSPTASTHLSP